MSYVRPTSCQAAWQLKKSTKHDKKFIMYLITYVLSWSKKSWLQSSQFLNATWVVSIHRWSQRYSCPPVQFVGIRSFCYLHYVLKCTGVCYFQMKAVKNFMGKELCHLPDTTPLQYANLKMLPHLRVYRPQQKSWLHLSINNHTFPREAYTKFPQM